MNLGVFWLISFPLCLVINNELWILIEQLLKWKLDKELKYSTDFKFLISTIELSKEKASIARFWAFGFRVNITFSTRNTHLSCFIRIELSNKKTLKNEAEIVRFVKLEVNSLDMLVLLKNFNWNTSIVEFSDWMKELEIGKRKNENSDEEIAKKLL